MFRNQISEILDKKIVNLYHYLTLKLKVDDFNYPNVCFFTGGCITSMLLNEKVNDFDLYFSDKKVVEQMKNPYLERYKEIKKYNIPDAQLDDFDPIFLSDNAIMLKNKVQLITRFVDQPEKIVNEFDFLHCKNYFTINSGVVTNQMALECILAKRLIYTGSKFPIAALIRVRKFLDKGWHITAGQLLKIAYDINKLDLDSYDTLKDQLKGVDVSYFGELIENMEKNQNNLTENLIFEMIDKCFEFKNIPPEYSNQHKANNTQDNFKKEKDDEKNKSSIFVDYYITGEGMQMPKEIKLPQEYCDKAKNMRITVEFLRTRQYSVTCKLKNEIEEKELTLICCREEITKTIMEIIDLKLEVETRYKLPENAKKIYEDFFEKIIEEYSEKYNIEIQRAKLNPNELQILSLNNTNISLRCVFLDKGKNFCIELCFYSGATFQPNLKSSLKKDIFLDIIKDRYPDINLLKYRDQDKSYVKKSYLQYNGTYEFENILNDKRLFKWAIDKSIVLYELLTNPDVLDAYHQRYNIESKPVRKQNEGLQEEF